MILIVLKLNKTGPIEPSKIFQEKATSIRNRFKILLDNSKPKEDKLVLINKVLIERLSQWKMRREDYNRKLEDKTIEIISCRTRAPKVFHFI